MSLAENLQYLRAREGVTQEQLAERLDVSRQSVSKWESGASFPEMDTPTPTVSPSTNSQQPTFSC